MMVVVAATTAAAGSNIRILGELALVFLLMSIGVREILSSSRSSTAIEIRRSLAMVVAPLAVAVVIVLIQQMAPLFF